MAPRLGEMGEGVRMEGGGRDTGKGRTRDGPVDLSSSWQSWEAFASNIMPVAGVEGSRCYLCRESCFGCYCCFVVVVGVDAAFHEQQQQTTIY